MDADAIALENATLADEAVLQNPFPFYARLREEDPVHYDRTLDAWLVSRYADVRTVLLDAETFSMERGWSTNYAHGFLEAVRNRLFLVTGEPGDALPARPDRLAHLAASLGTTATELRERHRRVTRRARRVVEQRFFGSR